MSPLRSSRPARLLTVGAACLVAAGLGLATVGPAGPAGAATLVSDPLTGLKVRSTGPVVAIKVANTPQARPQSGLRAADQIWVEEQEAGWTRFIAFYASSYPAKVGPVRSARETDLQVLPQFGRAGLAYAGADTPVQSKVSASRTVLDLGKSASVDGLAVRPSSYYFDRTRREPYNFYVNAARLRYWAKRGDATKARPMGFSFGRPKAAGTRARSLNVVWAANASMQAAWSPSLKAWVMKADKKVLLDRDTRRPLTAKNIVVMRVAYSLSKVNRSTYKVPVLKTVGRGSAIVLRDGRRWTGTWSRTALTKGTALRDLKGRTITLGAGQTWVLLVPVGRSLVKPWVQHSVSVR